MASGFGGRYQGSVVDDADPIGEHRLRVIVPEVWGTEAGAWAVPSLPPGGAATPAVGDLVWVTFEGGDTDYPIWDAGAAPDPDAVPADGHVGRYRALLADNVDPMEEHRLNVKIPEVLGDDTTAWAKAAPDLAEVLDELDNEFEAMYSRIGRPSVPPEQLLKATVLMARYSMRSGRAFCERLNYDLLFKWFLDLPIDAKAFDPTTFTKNRDRLLEAEIADRFFAAVVRQAKLRRYVSSDHFSVDGTLLEAWASHKSFKPKDGPRARHRRFGSQRRGQLPRPQARQPDPPFDHRSRSPPGPQGPPAHRRGSATPGTSSWRTATR